MKNRTLLCLLLVLLPAAAEAPPARFFIEPYLQNPRSGSLTVIWWTTKSEPESRIEYTLLKGKALLKKVAASNDFVPRFGRYKHEAEMTGLRPRTGYHYRAISGTRRGRLYCFRSLPDHDDALTIAVLGDGRTDDDAVIARHRAVVKQSGRAHVVFEIGDMVKYGSTKHWERFLRRILTASDETDPGVTVGSLVPYLMAVGNHEIYVEGPEEYAPGQTERAYAGGGLNTSMERFKAICVNPPNGSKDPRWEERYYSLKLGPVTAIVLDTNNTSADEHDNHDLIGDGESPDWHPGSEQHKWLIAELKRARKESTFTFVMMHPASYSRGVHGSPDPKQDQQRGYELRVLDPLFREYGVDLVFASHDHMVEHCLTGPSGFETKMDVADPKNLNYLVMGNSGQKSRRAAKGWEKWMRIDGDPKKPFHTKWFYPWAGDHEKASFLRCRIEKAGEGPRRATFEVVMADGEVAYEFSIAR